MYNVMRKNVLLLIMGFTLLFASCNKQDDNKTENSEKPNVGNTNGGSKTDPKKEDSKPETPQDNPKTDTPQPEPDPNTLFVKKILLEDITGTWCPHCPKISEPIEKIKANKELAGRGVFVAIHANGSGRDHMSISAINSLLLPHMTKLPEDKFYNRYPFAIMNREKQFYGALSVYFDILNAQKTSPLGIKIESSLKENSGDVKVSFKSREDYKNLKYTIFITESNYKYSQAKDGFGYIDFIHNDILVGTYGNPSGNNLGEIKKGKEVSKECKDISFKRWTNDIKNVKVVVFITDESGRVINAQDAVANQKVDYQYVK